MTRTWADRALVGGLIALCLSGCKTPGQQPTPDPGSSSNSGKVAVTMNPPREQTLDLPDFELDWDDLDRDDRGRPEAYALARWVTERHSAAQRCMEATPPATSQAQGLLREILARVPDNSRARAFLAQIEYELAAYWYSAADAIEYDMAWVDYKHELPPSKGGGALTDDEVTAFLGAAQPQFDACTQRVGKHAQEALQHYLQYRGQRPDDQSVPDKLWRLFLYVQNAPKALEWLDYVMVQMDQAGVIDENPVRRSYVEIRRALSNHVAQARLSGGAADGRGIFPWSQDAGAAAERRARVGGGQ